MRPPQAQDELWEDASPEKHANLKSGHGPSQVSQTLGWESVWDYPQLQFAGLALNTHAKGGPYTTSVFNGVLRAAVLHAYKGMVGTHHTVGYDDLWVFVVTSHEPHASLDKCPIILVYCIWAAVFTSITPLPFYCQLWQITTTSLPKTFHSLHIQQFTVYMVTKYHKITPKFNKSQPVRTLSLLRSRIGLIRNGNATHK